MRSSPPGLSAVFFSRKFCHGFNTDTIQAGKELAPVNYGDGGTRAMALEHGEIAEQIIGAAFEVYSILGYGFLEKVYQRAMQVELRSRGLKAEIEHKIKVWY